ncbi:GDSL-type esterase/lipase family protein [Gilvimarinus sp. SDUM040013]|uniref:GDSL-type esterase/lipase family protein n=1 Tax=Gilvimarinus gilvus TaxID=3058038 RepID=A0ABU4RVN4_9GAMM|nr:SGNH/GDSL hydrolase family protein [Gilvimarinus sp. SDUM040013]MDO3387252.1 GDSL-type esterase/lipase family protein [Gilvimarinus sp. SDUM040013]MDX6848941.1 GDSL-type esterase/lipase family protein [Gilvimarinus sp. SDUM040013]
MLRVLIKIKMFSLVLVMLLVGSAAWATDDFAKLRMMGRFEVTPSQKASFTWPGSTIEFNFYGTEASIEMSSEQRVRFQLTLDGLSRDLWLEPGTRLIQLAQGLPLTEHTVRLTRLAESFSGVTALQGLPEVDGRLLAPPPASGRRLLVIGDSITAGYGVEGESKDCSYSQDTSNPTQAYAGLAAAELAADIHTIAWSGIGVWRSYGEEVPSAPTIGERRRLTLADNFSTIWPVAKYQPDAVVVTIGTNDFWQGSAPGYQAGMQALVDALQKDYVGAPIYLVASPMLSGEVRTDQISQLQALADEQIQVLDLGRIEADDGFGCDWHPNVVTNQRMANNLVAKLKQDLQW